MQSLYLMCGLAFAGKSTLAAAISSLTGSQLISLDAINLERGLRGGLGISDAEWLLTHEIACSRVEASLRRGESVVVDDTNCFRSLRDSYRAVSSRCGARAIIVHVDTSLEVAIERLRANALRQRRPEVSEEILLALAARFEFPEPDETTVVYRGETDLRSWVRASLLSQPPEGANRSRG